MIRRVAGTAALMCAALVIGILLVRISPAPAESAGDVGYRDFSYSASGVSAPTGQKPQSKLWHNDGSWWGTLFSQASESRFILFF